jgi:hypothetical protein
VKLAEIRVGEEYAVRLSFRRLAVEGLEIIGGSLKRAWLSHGAAGLEPATSGLQRR